MRGPAVRDVMRLLKVRHPNAARDHLLALERKGLVERERYGHRAIWPAGLRAAIREQAALLPRVSA